MSVISDPKIRTQKIHITNWHTRRQFSTWPFDETDRYHLNNCEILKYIYHLLLLSSDQEANVSSLHNSDLDFLI